MNNTAHTRVAHLEAQGRGAVVNAVHVLVHHQVPALELLALSALVFPHAIEVLSKEFHHEEKRGYGRVGGYGGDQRAIMMHIPALKHVCAIID